jgi:hypothetical protein
MTALPEMTAKSSPLDHVWIAVVAEGSDRRRRPAASRDPGQRRILGYARQISVALKLVAARLSGTTPQLNGSKKVRLR